MRTLRSKSPHAHLLPRLLVLFLFASIGAACAAPTRADPPVTIFLLRHAEKSDNDKSDPDLSDAGRARAGALASELEHAGVTHLYATEFKRTQQTLAPLAARCGRAIDLLPAASVQQQIAVLLDLPPGSVAVVAGHSNTIPVMARALGATLTDLETGPDGEVLPDYGRLLLVIRPAQAPRPTAAFETIRLQFGDAWSASRPAR